jgi:hypothetical protein
LTDAIERVVVESDRVIARGCGDVDANGRHERRMVG